MARRHRDPLAGLQRRLTPRTLLVLRALAAQPGASNRQVAELAGITDLGQASKLLARLAAHGLVENTAPGAYRKGAANAWKLTRRGAEVDRVTRRTR